jgi:hypothetical protein
MQRVPIRAGKDVKIMIVTAIPDLEAAKKG